VDDDGPNAAGLKRDERRERLALLGLSAPALLLVFVTMVLPVGWLFGLSFQADDGSTTAACSSSRPTAAPLSSPSRSAS
jgi:ABC-type sugar transport system permease subunit